tara:strand:+ start:1442 stop:2161 length:720 start_codon:yes stop_codon:yes gene_type:complete
MALPKLNVPQYKVKLPSSGKELNMRPFLVREEKVLLIALESNDAGQIAEAVRNIIMGCYGFNDKDMDKLTVFDVEYLFLQLRGKSVGENMKLRLNCNDAECDGKTEYNINIDNIEIQNKEISRTIMLDKKNGVGVQMQFPSLNTIKSLNPENLTNVDVIMEVIISCIESIFDDDNVYDVKKESSEELTSFLESLNSEQFLKLQKFLENAPAVYHKGNYKCIKCGRDNTIELRGLNSFFT